MINLSENVQLETVTINSHLNLVELIQRIYPPAYKHLWQNEDCSFYVDTFYNIANLKLELSNKNAEYYFIIYKNKPVGICRIQFNEPLNNLKNGTYIHRMYLGIEAQGKRF